MVLEIHYHYAQLRTTFSDNVLNKRTGKDLDFFMNSHYDFVERYVVTSCGQLKQL